MKVTDIKNVNTTELYIGKSKSWKKAWLASMAKWERAKRLNKDLTHQPCGFCFVTMNRNKISLRTLNYTGDYCSVCPAFNPCGVSTTKRAIQWLKDNKQRIYTLDKESNNG